MRFLIPMACLSLCLHGCGGDTSVVIVANWGGCDFHHDKWKHADHAGRGCMMASFFAKHHPEQMSAGEVMRLLGQPTVYAGEGRDPAYAVEAPAADGGRAGEQLLVFRTDPGTGRVVEAQLLPAS